jgi:hypothetical protein
MGNDKSGEGELRARSVRAVVSPRVEVEVSKVRPVVVDMVED